MPADTVGSGTDHLVRPRLTTPLRNAVLIVVEAGGGWGKTALAAELAAVRGNVPLRISCRIPDKTEGTLRAALADAARRAGHMETSAVLGSVDDSPSLIAALDTLPEPALLIVDDLENLRDQALTDLVGEVASAIGSPHGLVLSGRHVPEQLWEVKAAADARLGTDDLALGLPEVIALAELLGTPLGQSAAVRLHNATGGWTAAVLLALRADVAAELGTSHLLERLLAPLGRQGLRDLGVLANLPMVDREVARALGHEDILQQAIRLGLPVRRLHGPWIEVASPARGLLATDVSLDRDQTVAASNAFADAGELRTAVRLLRNEGLTTALADLLQRTSLHALLRGLGEELLEVVAQMDDNDLRRCPGGLIAASATCMLMTFLPRREAVVARLTALDLCGTAGRRARAEQAHEMVWSYRSIEEGRRIATEVLDTATETEIATLATAHEALGRSMAIETENAASVHDHYTQAARLWARLGEPTREAWVLTWRAVQAEWDLGHHHSALKTLDRAMGLAQGTPHLRVAILPFRAMVLVDAGRYDEADRNISEAQRLAAVLGASRRGAYAAWMAARGASQQGDAAATEAAIHDAERLGLTDSGGGWIYAADFAQLLDRVGMTKAADHYLTRAIQGDDGRLEHAVVARLVVHARRGLWQQVEEDRQELTTRTTVSYRDQWRLDLLQAWSLKDSDPPRCAALAARAFDAAAALGAPDMPLVREPDVARKLLDVACREGSSASTRLREHGAARIRVMGTFNITDRGRDITPALGMSTTVLAILALEGGRTVAERLIETLWPGVSRDKGRERLRVVLYRLRGEVGDLVRREGDQVRLAPGVVTDLARFEDLAGKAISHHDVGAAEAALFAYGGELLPALPYEEWTLIPRRRLALRYLAVLDLLVDDAESSGDLDRAARLLQLGLDVDPEDDEVSIRLAGLLVRQGRRVRATAVLTHTRQAREVAGAPSSPALNARITELRGPGLHAGDKGVAGTDYGWF